MTSPAYWRKSPPAWVWTATPSWRRSKARTAEDDVVEEARLALENGIQGVPAFLFAERYLVSGAHPPDALRGFVDKVQTLLGET